MLVEVLDIDDIGLGIEYFGDLLGGNDDSASC